MKNLVFAFAILMGSMLCACGGRSSCPAVEPTIDSIEVVADSVASDTVLTMECDTVAIDTIQ